jgi:hypothetical protein
MQNASIAVVPMAIVGVAPEAHIRSDKQSNPGHAGTIAATAGPIVTWETAELAARSCGAPHDFRRRGGGDSAVAG